MQALHEIQSLYALGAIPGRSRSSATIRRCRGASFNSYMSSSQEQGPVWGSCSNDAARLQRGTTLSKSHSSKSPFLKAVLRNCGVRSVRTSSGYFAEHECSHACAVMPFWQAASAGSSTCGPKLIPQMVSIYQGKDALQ